MTRTTREACLTLHLTPSCNRGSESHVLVFANEQTAKRDRCLSLREIAIEDIRRRRRFAAVVQTVQRSSRLPP